MQTITVTCHTPDCGNNGVPIEIAYDPVEFGPFHGVCGPCGQPLDDVQTREHSDDLGDADASGE